MTEIIQIKDLKVHYPIRSGFFNRITDHVLAVDGVDFMIEQGKTYGLVVNRVLENQRQEKQLLV